MLLRIKLRLLTKLYVNTYNDLTVRNGGIWRTVLMRGCKLNSLTPSNGGTTTPVSYFNGLQIGEA